MLKISLSRAGLLDPAKLSSWSLSKQVNIRKAVTTGMRAESRQLVESVRNQMKADFTVKQQRFLRSVRAQVFNRNPNKLPALLIGSKISWLGVHMRGGTIAGRMLIPLTEEGRRIGRRAFKRIIDALISSGNAYFIQKDGMAILMAENIRENQQQLRRFKRAERARAGTKSIKRGQEIPIAVLVPRVSLSARFNLAQAVQRQLPNLAHSIEMKLKTI
ncbi:DUF6441 family protein [Nitrosomonas communis]|uniref:Prophage minor tail protein Z (GPZ) n=1 Tax=Nitrosomonas communis TaxID=44574 RepID=A0A1I4NBU7_9PROT|nr:DUF6441 family protein [Nitrosomonas communis]SFM13004.1 hypothetical protein SAMN05421863_101434 [Nitrosomonas communis]